MTSIFTVTETISPTVIHDILWICLKDSFRKNLFSTFQVSSRRERKGMSLDIEIILCK